MKYTICSALLFFVCISLKSFGQAPNLPSNPSPANQSGSVATNANLCATVSDPNAGTLQVRYFGRPKPANSNQKFTIILLPDTQYYTEEPQTTGNFSMFSAQTSWIASNRETMNIVYVGQLGDCSQNGDNPPGTNDDAEWQRVNTAISTIESPALTGLPQGIPFGLSVGNHDQTPNGGGHTAATTKYNQYFGVSHFTGRNYYGGHQGTNNDNHYDLFSASGIDFLVISMEYDTNPEAAVLDWAANLVQTYSNRKVIVMTHFGINETGSPKPTFGTQGQAIYDKLKQYPNFMLFVCGHIHQSDGEAQRTDVYNGNTVYTILSDYQGRPGGGNGLLRIMEFDPSLNKIAVKTFSPYANIYETDADSQFDVPFNMLPMIGQNNTVTSGTTSCLPWNNLAAATDHEWSMELYDGQNITRSPVWSFTTAAADITPPVVSSVSPVNGATDVSTSTSASAIFNEAMDPATINSSSVELRDPSNALITAVISYNAGTRTVTVTPSAALANLTVYTAILKGGPAGAKDAADNPLTTDYSWSFTTVAGDITPPLITSVSPVNESTGVSTGASVTAIFNEPMSALSITASTIELRDQSNALIPATVTYNIGTATATLSPSVALTNSTTYTVLVKSGSVGVKDAAQNPLATDYTWSFTTVAGDITPPTITSVTPVNGSTGVSISTTLTAAFSEAMNATTISSSTIELRNASNVLIATTISYNATTRTTTITPSAALTNSTIYTALVKGGSSGVKDAAQNPLATDYTWSFTTVAGDITPPTITSVTPVNGSTGVSISTTLTAAFSEAMNATTISSSTIELRNASNVLIATTISYNATTRTATIASSATLTNSTVYTATIKSGAPGVKDAAQNPLATDYTWSFTTVAGDITPPTITSVTPVNGSTGVSISTTLTAAFSEAMNATTISSSTIELRNASNVLIAATISYNATTRTVTIAPSSALANSTVYTVLIKSGASGVKDAAANALVNNYTWSFTTVAATQPSVTIQSFATKTGTSATTHSLTGVPAGALLVLATTSDAVVTNCTVSSTPVLTWTKRSDAGASNSDNAEIWTAVYTAGGSINITGNWGNVSQSSVCYVVLNAESVLAGASATATLQTAPSVSITTTRTNSIIVGCSADWKAINGTTRTLRDAATERLYFKDANFTTYHYTKTAASIAAYTEGVSQPTGQQAGTALLEIRGNIGAADIVPPTVTSVTPTNGSAGVSINTTASAIFSEAMDAATINSSTIELRNAANTLIAATISYNAGTRTASITPSAALTNSTSYTARIKSGTTGVKDAAANPLAVDYTWSFTTGTTAPPTNVTIQSFTTKTGTAATTHSLTAVPTGALLVLATTSDAGVSNCNVSSTPALTWTKRSDAGASNSDNAEIWTAVYTAGGSVNITSNWGNVSQSSVCYVVLNAESVLAGASATATLQAAPSVSITTTRTNSIIIGCSADWKAINGTTRTLRDAATERLYFKDANFTTYHYTKNATSIAAYTEGVSLPTGQQASTALLELRGNASGARIAQPAIITRSSTPPADIISVEYSLSQNYPNPFNNKTTIEFNLPKAGKVSVTVFDINGRVMKVLISGAQDAGKHHISFNAGSLSKGIYYYRMQTPGFSDVKKLIIQ